MHPSELVKAEFHCHTCYSKDSLVTVQDLLSTCQKKGIHRLVITDHNSIQGAVTANELDPARFIIGEEIMTQQGELLGIFMKEQIPAGLLASEAIDLLRSQEAFISVSHPFDTMRSGHWEMDDLLNIISSIDAVEIFNSRCIDPKFNTLARDFSQKYHLLGTVGSDSHTLGELGKSTLTLPDFHDAVSLKSALALAQPHVRLSSPWVHFLSSYARWRKQRRASSNIP